MTIMQGELGVTQRAKECREEQEGVSVKFKKVKGIKISQVV